MGEWHPNRQTDKKTDACQKIGRIFRIYVKRQQNLQMGNAPKPKKFEVSARQAGQTLASELRRLLELPWSQARKLCEDGRVRVDGQTERDPARRMRRGECVEVGTRSEAVAAERVALVYEDVHVVVLDKPAGISSVPYEKRERGTAMDLVRQIWRAAGRPATLQPLYVVHRIDKETSGLLAFAKTKLGERGLQNLFRAHDVLRSYICVAHGKVNDRRIETRLCTDRGDGLRGSTWHKGQGKRAVTHVRAVKPLGEATLCEVRLETGKTHQIRIHLAESGHPLVGEKVYIRDFLRAKHTPLPSQRLLLHAATLGFVHPVSGKKLHFESPLPPDFILPAPPPARSEISPRAAATKPVPPHRPHGRRG